MTAILERRFSTAARWSRSLASLSAAVLLVSGLLHRFGFLEAVPFFWLLSFSALAAGVSLCLAAIAVVQVWEHGVAGLSSAAAGAIIAGLVLAPFAVSGYRILAYPRLNDVATDLEEPLRFNEAPSLRIAPMNELDGEGHAAALEQGDAYPELGGRRYQHSMENVVQAVEVLLLERGWQLLVPLSPGEIGSSLTLEAVGYSFLLGFPSDVVIRIEDRGDATYVDMRSASRYGRHDMGDNAHRIKRFLDDLDRKLEEESAI